MVPAIRKRWSGSPVFDKNIKSVGIQMVVDLQVAGHVFSHFGFWVLDFGLKDRK
jgi:hypothetical protein